MHPSELQEAYSMSNNADDPTEDSSKPKVDLEARRRLIEASRGRALLPAGWNEHIDQISKAFAPLMEFSSRLEGILRPVNEDIARIAKEFREVTLPKLTLSDAQMEMLKELTTGWQEAFNELPENTRRGLMVMAGEGWYLDTEMPFTAVGEFEQEIKNGSREDLLKLTEQYFRSQASRISKDLQTVHPDRAKVLKSAFDAHDAGQYDLCIPVLLIQADGICKHLTEKELFSNVKSKSVATWIEDLGPGTFLHALASPLAVITSINASKESRPEGFDALNRHQVLHGEVVDYGTELNSLKAISYINFVSFALSRDRVESGEKP